MVKYFLFFVGFLLSVFQNYFITILNPLKYIAVRFVLSTYQSVQYVIQCVPSPKTSQEKARQRFNQHMQAGHQPSC